MKSKKKIIIISTVFVLLAIIVMICLFYCGINMSIQADELSMDTNWKRDITYSMLSQKLKDVISEKEFNDRTDAGLYNMYRKLEGFELEAQSEGDPSTDWWKTTPYDIVETGEGKFFVDIRIDFKAHLTWIEVINFVTHIHPDD